LGIIMSKKICHDKYDAKKNAPANTEKVIGPDTGISSHNTRAPKGTARNCK